MNRDDASTVARTVVDHPYRRILLALLDSEEPPISVHELARAVFAYDLAASDVADGLAPALDRRAPPPASVVETMIAQLHHSHLPRLVAAGLLTYDADDRVVTSWSHPAVGDRWLTAPPVDELATVIADMRAVPQPASD